MLFLTLKFWINERRQKKKGLDDVLEQNRNKTKTSKHYHGKIALAAGGHVHVLFMLTKFAAFQCSRPSRTKKQLLKLETWFLFCVYAIFWWKH